MIPTASLQLVFDILARDNGASRSFRDVGNAAERAGKQGETAGSAIGRGMKLAAGAIAAAGLGSAFVGFVQDARESARVSRITEAAIRSTGGAANVTAAQVGDLATALSNKTAIDDEAVQSASNLLLTFTRVRNEAGRGNDIFNQATEAALDMSVAMGTDANAAALQLGKALNDPIKGLTTLGRAGVQFTEQQKEQIRTLVETGDVLGAQRIILAELETQFGGVAEAAADPLQRLQVVAGNLGEEVGGLLLPAIEDFAEFVMDDLIPAVREGASWVGDNFGPAFEVAAGFVGDLVSIGGDVVEFFADLPTPVLAGAAALGAFLTLRGPLSSAFDTIALRALYMKDAIAGASLSTAGFKAAGTGLLGAFGGPLGLAITGVTAGLTFLIPALSDTGEVSAETAGFQRDLAAALRESKGVIDENVRAMAARRAEDTQVGDSSLLEWAEDLGIELPRVTDALLGNRDAYGEITAAIDAQIAALELRGTTLGRGASAEAQNIQNQITRYRELQGALDEQTGSMTAAVSENQRLAAAEGQSATAATTAADATATYTAELESAQEAADAAKRATDGFKFSLDILTGAQVSLIEVESAFQATLAEVEGALEGLNGTVLDGAGNLNTQSEAGRAASDVLLDVRNAGNELIATLIQQGATADEVRRRDAQLRASFIETARQMGVSQAEAEELANDILGVPEERNTQINTDVEQAMRNVDALQTNIENTHGKDITIAVRAAGRFIVNPQGGLQEFAEGGYTGPGGKWDVRGLVHAGEYVFSKAQTDRLGIDFLEALANSGAPGYADGGFVLTHDTRPIEAAMAQVAAAISAAAPKVGVAGGGTTGGTWHSLWEYVKARVPAARINSTFRLGDPGYHGRNKAIDFGYGTGPGGAGSAGLALINRVLHDGLGVNLAELIYDGIGDDRPDLKNGRPLTYSASTRAQHTNHVHAAVYDQGGILPPGLTVAYNGTGQNEYVSKAPGPINMYITLDSGEVLRVVDARIEGAQTALINGITYAGVR